MRTLPYILRVKHGKSPQNIRGYTEIFTVYDRYTLCSVLRLDHSLHMHKLLIDRLDCSCTSTLPTIHQADL